jgi:hypothetical protein
MGTDCTEDYLLILAINFVKETFVCKCAIVGVIMLDKNVELEPLLFQRLSPQGLFC